MKATLKPTDQPGTFGITIDDMTEKEAKALVGAVVAYYGRAMQHSADTGEDLDESAAFNVQSLFPVLEAGIAAVEGKE